MERSAGRADAAAQLLLPSYASRVSADVPSNLRGVLMKRVVLLTALASMMTMIAACGSDEKRLSTEEFLKQGNAICDAGNTAIDAAGEKLFPSGGPTPELLTTFANDVLVPSVQGQINDLKALSPPADLEDEVDKLLADAQTALDKVKADPVPALNGPEDPFADVNVRAAKIGLTACAGGDGGN